MRISTKMSSDNAIFYIMQAQNRLNQINEQLNSERTINRPSDDPISSRRILDMQEQISSTTQYIDNVKNAKTWTSVASTTLQAMTSLITEGKRAATMMLDGSADPTQSQSAISTLNDIRKSLIDLGNTQISDEYLFGGFKNTSPVFSSKTVSGAIDTVSKPVNLITGINTGINALGTTALGSNTVTMVPPLGLAVGMEISGAGIPPHTTVTGIGGANITISKNATANGVGTTLAFGSPPLTAGMTVSGEGIPANTTIVSVTPSTGVGVADGTITLSSNPAAALNGAKFTFGPAPIPARTDVGGGINPLITGIDTTSLVVGMQVSGPGIPDGTTITGIPVPGVGGTIAISKNPTVESVAPDNFSFTLPPIPLSGPFAVQRTISGIDTTIPLAIGNTVDGPGIPPSQNTFGDIPAGSTTINNINTAGIQVGMGITNANIPAGTTVTAIGANSITISQASTNGAPVIGAPLTIGTMITGIASAGVSPNGIVTITSPPNWIGSGPYSFNGAPAQNGISNQSLVTVPSILGLAPGMSVTGPGIANNVTISKIVDATHILLSDTPLPLASTLNGTYEFASSNITPAGGGTAQQAHLLTLGGLGTTDLEVGMTVTGAGIPANTTITKILNGTDIALSNALTLTAATNISFSPAIMKSGTVSIAQPNEINGLATTVGLMVGMSVTGPGVQPDTEITGVTASGVTVSKPFSNSLLLAGTNTFTFGAALATRTGVTDPPNQITGLSVSVVQNLYVGMKVTGNVPDNTTITGINASGTGVTLSNIPLATAGIFNFTFEGYVDLPNTKRVAATTTTGSTTLTLPSTTDLKPGMLITGAGIPGMSDIPPNPPTTIVSITDATHVVVSAASVPAPTAVPTQSVVVGGATPPLPDTTVVLASTVGLAPGMIVTGPGIPASPPTTIASITNGTDIVLSVTPVAPFAAGASLNFFNPGVATTAVPVTITAGNFSSSLAATTNLSNTVTLPTTAGLAVGMIVNGPGIPVGPPETTITSINVNGVDLTLSANATATVANPPGVRLSFNTPGLFPQENLDVEINRSSKVTLNYPGAKMLLGGTPSATVGSTYATSGAAPTNILGIIGALMTAIQNNDADGIRAGSANLKVAGEQLTQVMGENSSKALRLESAETRLASSNTTLENIVSDRLNIDYAKTVVELNQQKTALEASYAAAAKITPLSLLDYLK